MWHLRFLIITGITAASVAATPYEPSLYQASSPSLACTFLRQNYPEQAYFPNDTEYKSENEHSWSSRAWLSPSCVFAPSNANEMSFAVKTLVRLSTPFAMRGGGHMPIDNAANIGSSGVLLSSSKLKKLELSSDNGTVSIGPGNRWSNVYQYLEPFGLTVVGGRMGVVGVPGFMLGGGISFFSDEYGFASSNDNVRMFECVLANGDIIEATATNEHRDLYWALKGGGNSFCIVTRFDLRTLAVPEVYVGEAAYGPGVADQWLDSIYSFAVNGSDDPKAAVTPIARYGSTLETPIYDAIMFYNGNNSSPAALENFTAPALVPLSNTFTRRSMYAYTQETDAPFNSSRAHGLRQRFYVVSLQANREAMAMIHDTYFSAAQAQLSNVTNFFTGMAVMPISKQFVAAGNARGGNPQGVDECEAPYIWVEQSYTWSDAADDGKIEEFIRSVNAEIGVWLESRGLTAPYLYLNDADVGQPVFEGYPSENLRRLREVRGRYDPEMVFTRLMPGGWKVEDV